MSNCSCGVTTSVMVLAAGIFSGQTQSRHVPHATNEMPASTSAFLSSLGVNTHVDQGYDPASYVEPLKYLGVRNIRDGQRNLAGYLMLHRQTGIHVNLVGADTSGLIEAAKTLARAGALLSIEGPNEPNNFPVTYKGHPGGGAGSWIPVAQLQRDLFRAVKNDPELASYPVFAVSEAGAETDNVGLQFLTIPVGASTLLPAGTRYADYANSHNYVSGHSRECIDNQAWQAADPTLAGRWDGLYVEYGETWRGHYQGYSTIDLEQLPRVTTETGWNAASMNEERTQGIILVNTYLAQFARGWRYTFIYELGESEGGGGNQGLFHRDWTPKLSATFIHNLTSVLAGSVAIAKPGRLDYSLGYDAPTVHHLLLQQSAYCFDLVIWGEQAKSSNKVTVRFGQTQSRVTIFDTTIGIVPIQHLNNVNTFRVTVSDHAIVAAINLNSY